jgi:hypothetical protein
LAFCVISLSGAASATECRLEIDGSIITAGPCELNGGSGKTDIISFSDEYLFVYLFITSEIDDEFILADGWWNNYADHAHDSLGQLRYIEDCWTGEKVKLCVRH